jgi:hypothetical protein
MSCDQTMLIIVPGSSSSVIFMSPPLQTSGLRSIKVLLTASVVAWTKAPPCDLLLLLPPSLLFLPHDLSGKLLVLTLADMEDNSAGHGTASSWPESDSVKTQIVPGEVYRNRQGDLAGSQSVRFPQPVSYQMAHIA